ncbi:MAG: hypothetical protein H6779_05255 [Candidatus Nomurabacteria bacterium]|nr:MAG: hypothetical protein H6779_05255 [Candidatus Nomurabacteria bacterium]
MKYIAPVLIITIAVILTASFETPKDTKDNIPRTVELATAIIPELHPHEHTHGDSMMQATHHKFSYSEKVSYPYDLWIKKISFNLQNADDTVLHHADLRRLDQYNEKCNAFRPILSIGEDSMYNPSAVLPDGYAQYIPKNTFLQLSTMFHNPLPPVGFGKEYKDVSTKITMTLASEEEINNLKPVDFIFLAIMEEGCGSTFTVPANTDEFIAGTSTPSTESFSSYTFPGDGAIVYMGAHLHGWEGGQALDVYLNGEPLKHYDTKKADRPYGYNTIHGQESFRVKAGDQITITATYSNPYPEPITGAMGMLGIYYAPDNPKVLR